MPEGELLLCDHSFSLMKCEDRAIDVCAETADEGIFGCGSARFSEDCELQ